MDLIINGVQKVALEEKFNLKKKYSNLVKDTLIFTLGNLGSKLILFFMVPLYTNYLTTEEYGTADLVFTVAQFVTPLISVVIHDAILRYGLSKDCKKENVLRIGYYIIAVDVFVVFLSSPIVELYTPLKPWKWYLCVYTVISIIDSIQFNYLKVIEKNKLFAVFSILKTACMASLNVLLLAVANIGVKGYLLANIVALSITNLLVFIYGKYASELEKSKHDSKLLKEMLCYSAPLILNNISWWVIQSSDKVMVEYMLGAAMLGLYTVAAKIPSLINVVISIFSQAWGISSVTEYESTNDISFYSTVQRIYLFVVCAACIIYVSFVKIFMRFYVGADFYEAWKYVPLLLVSAVFSSVSSFYGSMYGALKKSVNNMLSTVFSALINIIINYLLIPLVGIWGAVIGTVVAYFFVAIYRMIDVRRYIHIKIDWKNFTINHIIIVLQAVFVSMDLYGYAFSLVAIVFFAISNQDNLKLVRNIMLKR